MLQYTDSPIELHPSPTSKIYMLQSGLSSCFFIVLLEVYTHLMPELLGLQSIRALEPADPSRPADDSKGSG
jgi:hypothetical protein